MFLDKIMDMELIKIVSEDLEFIAKEWNSKDISEQNLRRSSSVLRRLLIEGDLYKASKIVGLGQIKVLSPKEYNSLPGQVYSQTAGGKHRDMEIYKLGIYDRVLTEEEIGELSRQGKEENLTELPIFLRKSGITIKGIRINGEEIIKYVCNKLGGAHYDTKRSSKNKNIQEKYNLLDLSKNTIRVSGMNNVYYELLSIGQRLVNSDDIKKLQINLKEQLANGRNRVSQLF